MRIRDWSSDVCSSDLLIFDEQCFAVHGHFAGEDGHRFAALVEMANRPDIDAIWFARGGYGACRIAQEAVAAMTGAARGKASSEERRVGKECVRTGRYRWGPDN